MEKQWFSARERPSCPYHAFHAEKDGQPAPAKVMEQTYLQTIPPEAVPIKLTGCSLPGFRMKAFEAAETEAGLQIFCGLLWKRRAVVCQFLRQRSGRVPGGIQHRVRIIRQPYKRFGRAGP